MAMKEMGISDLSLTRSAIAPKRRRLMLMKSSGILPACPYQEFEFLAHLLFEKNASDKVFSIT